MPLPLDYSTSSAPGKLPVITAWIFCAVSMMASIVAAFISVLPDARRPTDDVPTIGWSAWFAVPVLAIATVGGLVCWGLGPRLPRRISFGFICLAVLVWGVAILVRSD